MRPRSWQVRHERVVVACHASDATALERRAFVVVLVLASAVGLGSWVGLGRPDAEGARALPGVVRARVAEADGPTAEALRRKLGIGPALPPEAAESAGTPDDDRPPTPLERDPSLLPDRREPWRSLNTSASASEHRLVRGAMRACDAMEIVGRRTEATCSVL